MPSSQLPPQPQERPSVCALATRWHQLPETQKGGRGSAEWRLRKGGQGALPWIPGQGPEHLREGGSSTPTTVCKCTRGRLQGPPPKPAHFTGVATPTIPSFWNWTGQGSWPPFKTYVLHFPCQNAKIKPEASLTDPAAHKPPALWGGLSRCWPTPDPLLGEGAELSQEMR